MRAAGKVTATRGVRAPAPPTARRACACSSDGSTSLFVIQCTVEANFVRNCAVGSGRAVSGERAASGQRRRQAAAPAVSRLRLLHGLLVEPGDDHFAVAVQRAVARRAVRDALAQEPVAAGGRGVSTRQQHVPRRTSALCQSSAGSVRVLALVPVVAAAGRGACERPGGGDSRRQLGVRSRRSSAAYDGGRPIAPVASTNARAL